MFDFEGIPGGRETCTIAKIVEDGAMLYGVGFVVFEHSVIISSFVFSDQRLRRQTLASVGCRAYTTEWILGDEPCSTSK
jgi:hypothetical protein